MHKTGCPCRPCRTSTVTTRENAGVGGLRVSGAPWTAGPPLPYFLTDDNWAHCVQVKQSHPGNAWAGAGGDISRLSFLTASRML